MAKYVVFFKDGTELAKDHVMNEKEFETFKKQNSSYYLDFLDDSGCCYDSWNEEVTLEDILARIKEELEDLEEESVTYRIGHNSMYDDYDILCIDDNGGAYFL